MFESDLGPLDFTTAELGAAWLEVMDRLHANVAAAEAELAAKRAEIYVAPDTRAKEELALGMKLRRLQDDQIAVGLVLDEARRRRATAGVGH